MENALYLSSSLHYLNPASYPTQPTPSSSGGSNLQIIAMASPTASTTTVTDCVSSVDCQKQVRSWRLLRSLLELLIPTCNCTVAEEEKDVKTENCIYSYGQVTTTITGTIFGYRRGKVNFCIQPSPPNSANPILLLELAVPTTILAKEMRGGTLRIVLEQSGNCRAGCGCSLLSTPLWNMYCNGRKVGYAVKRRPSNADLEALRLMSWVVVGAGVINGNAEDDEQLMYLRAKFQTVGGSSDSESFHLIDPEGSIAQELSIFFLRSRSTL